MKEIFDDRANDCSKQTHLQIELAFDILTTDQLYTSNPRWDALENAHDPYWDTLEEETQQDESCDILDQQCLSSGNFSQDNLGEAFVNAIVWDSAHQQSASVGEQIFIASQHQLSAPQQYKSVGAQVLLATKSDLSETSVGAQVTLTTEKSAPQHEKLAHWIEKYWVERAGNKYWYFRYRWMSGRKSNRVYLGSVQSRLAQRKVELVKEAIADGKSPCEIKQLIKGEYD